MADLHVSAKGCVVRDNCLLLAQYRDVNEVGHHYNLPGGRIKPNERLEDACRRKIYEETGAEIKTRELLFVYEYIGENHKFFAGDKHSVSLIFRCDLLLGSEPSMMSATKPDLIQTDVCWIPIENKLKKVLLDKAAFENLYWGDIL
jgi:ADP-ribose pyrophosphatase YjhB (NUDIX family)